MVFRKKLIEKNTLMAATIYNERFGAMAGVLRRTVLQNSKLSGSWRVCESQPSPSRHCVNGKWWTCKKSTMCREALWSIGERN
jgi:hypothetical protein